MVHIDLPRLLGLARTDDGTFRSRRISMFPPSYADRAMTRHLKRQALRQSGSEALKSTPASLKQSRETPSLLASNASMQTELSYCYHQCPCHKEASTSTTLEKNAASNKEDSQAQEGEKKDGPKSEGKKKKSQSILQNTGEFNEAPGDWAALSL